MHNLSLLVTVRVGQCSKSAAKENEGMGKGKEGGGGGAWTRKEHAPRRAQRSCGFMLAGGTGFIGKKGGPGMVIGPAESSRRCTLSLGGPASKVFRGCGAFGGFGSLSYRDLSMTFWHLWWRLDHGCAALADSGFSLLLSSAEGLCHLLELKFSVNG
ncbi:hypothetical protein C8J57DRAFT_1487269 [Mycena rebaudengoi]|nr:hypothetical protein C8J57DRAFT_1487269 [Mycena rebaudengoi]